MSDRIRELIRDRPDLTLRELKAELKTDLSVHIVVLDNLGAPQGRRGP